jgi:hypothetical protein
VEESGECEILYNYYINLVFLGLVVSILAGQYQPVLRAVFCVLPRYMVGHTFSPFFKTLDYINKQKPSFAAHVELDF